MRTLHSPSECFKVFCSSWLTGYWWRAQSLVTKENDRLRQCAFPNSQLFLYQCGLGEMTWHFSASVAPSARWRQDWSYLLGPRPCHLDWDLVHSACCRNVCCCAWTVVTKFPLHATFFGLLTSLPFQDFALLLYTFLSFHFVHLWITLGDNHY